MVKPLLRAMNTPCYFLRKPKRDTDHFWFFTFLFFSFFSFFYFFIIFFFNFFGFVLTLLQSMMVYLVGFCGERPYGKVFATVSYGVE